MSFNIKHPKIRNVKTKNGNRQTGRNARELTELKKKTEVKDNHLK